MQQARTKDDGSEVQAMKSTSLTVSLDACRPPERARAAMARTLGAAAVRSEVTWGWMSAAIAATADFIPACMTGVRFIDVPSGSAGIVGRAGVVGTAGITGVGVAGTGSTGVLGAGVIGAMVVLGAGVGTTGAGIAVGALGIGNGAGVAVGGLVGGVTGAAIAGFGGATGFIGKVRGGSATRDMGGKNALPRLGSIVRPRGGSPVERSGINLGASVTLAVPAASVWGAAPSKTEVVGEKILGLIPAFVFIFAAGP